jgi:putative hydrolase
MATDPFGEIPLFRELNKLLSATEGPVNLEIARQVADAIAAEGGERKLQAHEVSMFDEAVHECSLVLAGYTRLSLDEPPLARAVDRRTWVASTLHSWRWLLEHLSKRVSDGMEAVADQVEGAAGMQAVVAQVAPLLLGIQAGTMVGHLAREALGRFDPLIPRDDDGRLLFLIPNIEQLAADYSLDLESLRRWLTLNDTARKLVLSASVWIDPYFRSLFLELLDSVEIDSSDVERRLMEMQSRGPEALEEGLNLDELIPIVPTERHTKAVARIRAFGALVLGYSKHAASVVAGKIVGDFAKLDEGMARHEVASTAGRAILQSVLGVEFDRKLETSGSTFCAAVVSLKDIETLNRVWEAPDNLPNLEEIKDPFAWMDRVVGE